MVFDLLPSSDGCIPQVSTSMLRVATARRWDRLAQPEMVTSRSAGRQSSRVAAAEGPGDVQRYVDSYVCIYIYINKILSIYIYNMCVWLCVCMHSCMYVLVDQNIFIRERPFFANKKLCRESFAAAMLSFAERMLSNNSSYEDSFTTCQITQNDHG
jgi:hypothetical protein